MLRVSSHFEAGHIAVSSAEDPRDVRLALLEDNNAPFKQWFYFRVSGARDQDMSITFTNAGGSEKAKGLAGHPDPWVSYQALASYDRTTWFRAPTTYDGEVVTIRLKPRYDVIYFANFAPYSLDRHADLVTRAIKSPRVQLQVIGHSLDGHDIDVLRIGEPGPAKKVCWFITRQHPGETQGSWMVEGAVDRLTDQQDSISRALLEKAVFYVVPNLNPDGSRRGNTRSNAAGANLNREWLNPSKERSPEVLLVRDMIHETGVNFCVDCHAWTGDVVFITHPIGIPSLTPGMTALWNKFEAALTGVNPDYRPGHPYPGGEPSGNRVDLGKSWNYIGEKFGALSVLVEQTFKDPPHMPDKKYGWSPQRAIRLGGSTLTALYAVIDDLR
jgi:murein tripeptide amidase MpaA